MLNISATEKFRQECIKHGYILRSSELAKLYEVSPQTICNNPELFKRGDRGFHSSDLPEVIEGYSLKEAGNILTRSTPAIMEYIKANDIKAEKNCLNAWRLNRNDVDKLRSVIRSLQTGQRYSPGGGKSRIKRQVYGFEAAAKYLRVDKIDIAKWVKQGLKHKDHRFKMTDLDEWKAVVDKIKKENVLKIINSGRFNEQIFEHGRTNLMFKRLLMQESIKLLHAGELNNVVVDYMVEHPKLRHSVEYKLQENSE